MTWGGALESLASAGLDRGFPKSVGIEGRQFLYDLSLENRIKRVLEIGTYVAASTVILALTGAEVVTVDIDDVNAPNGPWLAAGLPAPPRVLVDRLGLSVEFIVGRSPSILDRLQGQFDLVFLDGSHNEEVVLAELLLASGRLSGSGVIVLHDVFPDDKPVLTAHRRLPGPWRAAQRFMGISRGEHSFQWIEFYAGAVVRMGVLRRCFSPAVPPEG